MINEMLRAGFSSFSYLPAVGASGGVLIACRSPDFSLSQLSVGKFSVSVLLTANDGTEPWCLTGVYGPQPDADKVEFLNELRSIQTSISCPWMIAGDFNLILDATDKNNLNLNRRNMGRFHRFVDEMELKDVPLHGRYFTWSSERENPTLEKLDRVLVTVD